MKTRAWCAVWVVLLSAAVAHGGTTGKIVGVVKDATGRPLSAASVVVEELGLGATSGDDGAFTILNVPPGRYRVAAHYIGYRSVVQEDVLVWVDLTTVVNFSLPQEALQVGEVVVQAVRPEVERDITSTVKNIGREEVERLPATTLDDVVGLQAGVVRSGGTLHIRGGRGNEVAFMVDGHRIGDPVMGDVPTDVNTEAIQQVELITGTFNAEYGNAMSGVVNVVTREASSSLRGNLTCRLSKLGIEDPSDNLNERYLEGTLSGPLASWMGFLVSGRLLRKDSYYQSGLLGEDGQPTGQLSGKPFGYDDRDNLFGKLSVRFTPGARLHVAYNYDDREWMNYVHDYKYIPDSAYVRTRSSHLIALTWSHTLRPTLFYEVRASRYMLDYLQNYGGLNYTEYSEARGQRDNNNEFYLTANNQEYEDEKLESFTGKVDVTWQANRSNLIRTGVEFTQHVIDYFSIYGPRRLPANQYIDDYRLKPYEGSAYVQDKLEFETLVMNLGLRFDFHHPRVKGFAADPNDPEHSRTDAKLKTQLSPRVGVSYPVTDKTVFHFAYGHFFQRPTYEVLYEDLSRKLTVNYPLIGDPNLEPERTAAYEFGLHTTFVPGTSVQTTLFSKKIRNLVGVVWRFKGPGVAVPYAYYTNEDFASVKGFEVKVRASRGPLWGVANYTYQIAEGSSSAQQERYGGAYEIAGRQSLQFYPLSFDQRHTFNGTLSVDFSEDHPGGLVGAVLAGTRCGLVFSYGSGFPFTYNPTRSRYQPDLNNARMPATYSFDLEVERRVTVGAVRLAVLLEVYNLFNRKNVVYVYPVTGRPDYSGPFTPHSREYDNDPTHYGDPRTVYVGLKVGF